MAPSRGKSKLRATNNAASSSRRTTRSTGTTKDNVPDVYQDLLAEAAADESSTANDTDRPLKKRRVVAAVFAPGQSNSRESGNDSRNPTASSVTAQQTVEDTSEAESDDDTDDDSENELDFENVDLEQPSAAGPDVDGNDNDAIQDLSISLDSTTTSKQRALTKRNKPISSTEKAFRVLIHKAHLLCLLGHCVYVNGRCNNETVQNLLRSSKILSKKTIFYFDDANNVDQSQFQRNRSFMDGLQQASDSFRGMFQVCGSGMRRARWSSTTSADAEDEVNLSEEADPADLEEFIQEAGDLKGSQDVGNQLFCALLRAVGMEARVVCSLQVLPFGNDGSSAKQSGTPEKYVKRTFYANTTASAGTNSAPSNVNTEDTSVQNSNTIGNVPAVRRRLGQPSFGPETSSLARTSPKKTKKPTRKLTYPVFWTEAFNAAHQKWVPVDPLVTQTVAKPSKFEPASSYEWNLMTYVIAFEEDGIARDVTRRYARAYNAKTRRLRVESAEESGAAWLKKALRIFRRRGRKLDREQLEDAELAQKEAREGLPKNVQDFKNHPYYALERHLKRNEVIFPKREVGKVNAGTAKMPRMEVVFRREDVRGLRGPEKWFRVGRVVRKGEVGLKRVPARKSKTREDGEEGEEMMALYDFAQTEPYIPPPVVKGKVPRNAYGNLDIYVPSMIPAGGAHIKHHLASQAARILRIDYADAVTGFSFKGRKGTAVVEGVIIVQEFEDAARAVIEGLEEEVVEEESKGRSAMALRVWRRFLVGLRIRERVEGYGGGEDVDLRAQIDDVEEEEKEEKKKDGFEAGGFFPDEGADDVAMPTAGLFSLDELMVSAKKNTSMGLGRKKMDVEESEEEYEQSSGGEEDEFELFKRPSHRPRHVVDEDSEDEYMPDASSTLFNEGDDGEGDFLTEDAEGVVDYASGGFFPEDVEEDGEGAGGFLLEANEAEMENDTNREEAASIVETEIVGETTLNITASYPAAIETSDRVDNDDGFMSGQAATDEALVPNTKENRTLHTEETPLANGASLFSANDSQTETDLPLVNGRVAVRREDEVMIDGGQPTSDVVDDVDNESDLGSMISHDPEDDDAEPDWLEMDSD